MSFGNIITKYLVCVIATGFVLGVELQKLLVQDWLYEILSVSQLMVSAQVLIYKTTG